MKLSPLVASNLSGFGGLPPTMPFPMADKRLVRRPADPVRKRARIWELSDTMHCSVIGTCLSTRELRQAMARIGVDRRDLTDHELHTEAVRAAGRHDAAGKILTKVLDQRHHVAIRRFDAARSEVELGALWRADVQQGEIPGAYWALLTHPLVTNDLIRRAFGEVHMLSHLVGAANRADIGRLCRLEEELGTLSGKLQRQQAQLREAVVSRDAIIRDLQAELARSIAGQSAQPEESGGDERFSTLESCVAALQRRLDAEQRRRESLERSLQQARTELAREREARTRAERLAEQLGGEVAALEAAVLPNDGAAMASPPVLNGRTLLYVGGRTHHIPHLRGMIQQLGADFLHHDGGVEDSTSLLAGLVARADHVVLPVDCVSHDAMSQVKRLCRVHAKSFSVARSSGAAALLASLSQPC